MLVVGSIVSSVSLPALSEEVDDGGVPDLSGDSGNLSAHDEFEGDEGAAEDGATPEPSVVPRAGIEEIVIMAEVMQGVTQDDPTSSVGFDARDLDAEGITDIRDLSNYTPNLEIKTAFAATNPTLFIRGVGLDDFNANSSSAVAVYQDEIYMNSPAGQLFQLFDVERLDVLRGPQGTLYRNASAGVIRVIAAKPTDEVEGYASATYGRFNQLEVEGAVNVPLISERLAARGAFKVARRDGITENRCDDLAKAPTPRERDPCQQAPSSGLSEFVNNTDNWAARGLLKATLPLPGGRDEMEWLLNLHGGKNASDATQYQHRGVRFTNPGNPGGVKKAVPGPDASGYQDTDGDPFAGDYDLQGPENLSVAGGSLVGSIDLSDSLELESVSGYEWHDRYTLDNTDGNPRTLLATTYEDEAWQFSEEMRLNLLWGDSGEATAGGYFLMEDLDVQNFFRQQFTSRINFDQRYSQKTRGFAFYGRTQFDLPSGEGRGEFLSNFSVEAGARYNQEHKTFDIVSTAFAPNGAPTNSLGPTSTDGTFRGVSGDLSLTYHFTEDRSLYLKYSRGWKPGHFNGGSVFSTQVVEPVDPETVDSIELGLRSEWFDGRLMFNLTGFAYKYDNLQVFQLEQDARGQPLPQLVNAQAASIYGAELEVRAAPIEGLDVRYNLGWLESQYNDFSTQFDETKLVAGQPVIVKVDADYSGNRLVASPVWAMNGAVEYTIPLRNETMGLLRPRFSFAWKDDIFFDVAEGQGARENLPEGTIGQDAYWVLNAGLSYVSPNERIEVAGWVRNLLDEHYTVQSFDVTSNFRFIIDVFAEPRTYGLTVTYNF